MKRWLTCYGDAAFQRSRERLVESAARHGIDEVCPWTREALEATSFYHEHRALLDRRRGGGYWLWKPFIVDDTLRRMAPGDVVVYCDAGLEIVASLDPLFAICEQQAPQLLFDGHHDDVGAPGPNLCGKWTKRDCFVEMGCDDERYHQARLLDASCLVLCNTPATRTLVGEWLRYCCRSSVLTDDPNVRGLPNLPEFIAHRHDQSVLSLLGCRGGLPRFRHPSQHGNHLKEEHWRSPGEWIARPYGSTGVFLNSPYGTLLDHHRGELGDLQLTADVRRTFSVSRPQVYRVWTTPEIFTRWAPLGYRIASVDLSVRPGGTCRWLVLGESGRPTELTSHYLEVQPGARLVHTWPLGISPTQVRVSFDDDGAGTAVTIAHGPFASERACGRHAAIWNDLLDIVAAYLAP